VNLALKAVAVWIALLLAIVLGGFLNATGGAPAVIAYGVLAFAVVIFLIGRQRRTR
jgi:hypothetical protein